MGSKSVTPGWVELGMYAPWFPYSPELEHFCYDVLVHIGHNYEVVGLGQVVHPVACITRDK